MIETKNRVLELSNDHQEKISASLSLCQTEVSSICSVTSKCFLNNLGHEGTVLSSKESVIILQHGTETVVTIDRFLSVRCEEQGCRLLGEGTVKPFHVNDSGKAAINILNGFHKVKTEPNGEKVFFQIENIQRKVMLYDCGNGAATVVDYMRKLRSLPGEVIVPVYPEEGDMLLIQGEQQNDIWHGKVLRVDRAKQIADLCFFIEKYQEAHKFIRETFGRAARNSVAFDSVLAIAEGHWIVQIAGKKKFDLFPLLFFKHLQITMTLFWKIKSGEREKKLFLQLLLTDSEFIDTI